MDPIQLTTETWDATRVSLNLLGLMALFALLSGSTLMLAHAILPSLSASKSFPSFLNRRVAEFLSGRSGRLGVYAAGLVFLFVTLLCSVLFVFSLGWIGDVFPNYWQ